MSQTSQALNWGTRWRDALTPLVILLIAFAVILHGVHWTSPWESDQAAKAAQILEIVDTGDWFLSAGLSDYYRVRQFPLYYFLSALAYAVIGGPIFTFMNLSGV